MLNIVNADRFFWDKRHGQGRGRSIGHLNYQENNYVFDKDDQNNDFQKDRWKSNSLIVKSLDTFKIVVGIRIV